MCRKLEKLRIGIGVLWLILGSATHVDAQAVAPAADSGDEIAVDGVRAPRPIVGVVKSPIVPPSVRLFGGSVPFSIERVLPGPDVEPLRREDQARAASGEKCWRVGVELAVDHDPTEPGAWVPDGEGGRYWSMQIVAPGARAMRVHFTQFFVPAPGEVYVRPSGEAETAHGPYAGSGIDPTGEFWSPTLEGDGVIVEYHEPKVADPDDVKVPFRVAGALFCYRDPSLGPSIGVAGCELDASCYSSWAAVGDAVGQLSFVDGGNGYVCTGVLLNTVSGDLTPYLLTANHCIATDMVARTLDVAWFYETDACNGIPPNINFVPHSLGATFLQGRSRSSLSDFTLLMINGSLPNGLFWAGWTTADPGFFDPVVGIHHPGGSWRRLSYGDTLGICTFDFHCVQWTAGTTEGGSSGSPLFDGGQRVVGQLWGGSTSCSSYGIDEYGQFSESYPLISSLLSGGSDDTLEPNDSCGSSRVVGDGLHSGLVVKSVDPDFYRIDVPPRTRLTASLSFTHANGDIDCEIYDACGGSVVASSNGIGNSESVSTNNASGATVSRYLRVHLYSDTRNSYSMTISFSACIGDDGLENNDACASAWPLPAGTFSSLLVSDADPDWFRVTAPPYSSVWVTASFVHAVADLDMTLHAACGGTPISSSTGSTDTETVAAANSTGTPVDFLVRVYVNNPVGDRGCSSYSLAVTATSCTADDLLEENDVCIAARVVAGGTLPSLLVRSGDDDWYQVAIPAGARLQASLAFTHSSGDIDLGLYDACGGSLVAASTGVGNSESVSQRSTGAARSYFLRVYLYSGTCNAYSLTTAISSNVEPGVPAAPGGPDRGFETVSVSFTATATDPEGDAVACTFVWGDSSSTTSGFVPSGTPVTVSHAYAHEGVYAVRAFASDAFGAASGLSTSRLVDVVDVDSRRGNVSADNGGGPVDVLRVGGGVGSNPERVISVDRDYPIEVFLAPSPDGPAPSSNRPIYAVWIWRTRPTSSSLLNLPRGVGRMSMNPILSRCAGSCPTFAANTLRRDCGLLLCSTPQATGATLPAVVLRAPAGTFSAGETLWIQGVLEDNSDSSGNRLSVTNGVEVSILP